MSFIEKNLLDDEKIIYRTKKHWIIFFAPTAWILVAIFFLFNPNTLIVKLAVVPAGAALILAIKQWLEYITADFVITNKRVLMKEGFFTKHSSELRLATVSNMNVDQSLVGQLLDYGTVVISPFGSTRDIFTEIAHPFEFQKQTQMQLDNTAR